MGKCDVALMLVCGRVSERVAGVGLRSCLNQDLQD